MELKCLPKNDNARKYYEVYLESLSGPMDSIVDRKFIGVYDNVEDAFKESNKHYPYVAIFEVNTETNKREYIDVNPAHRIFKKLRVYIGEEYGCNKIDDPDWMLSFTKALEETDYSSIDVIFERIEYISEECYRIFTEYIVFDSEKYIHPVFSLCDRQVTEMDDYIELDFKIKKGISIWNIQQDKYEAYTKQIRECKEKILNK